MVGLLAIFGPSTVLSIAGIEFRTLLKWCLTQPGADGGNGAISGNWVWLAIGAPPRLVVFNFGSPFQPTQKGYPQQTQYDPDSLSSKRQRLLYYPQTGHKEDPKYVTFIRGKLVLPGALQVAKSTLPPTNMAPVGFSSCESRYRLEVP